MKIFISHISEEGKIAKVLKEWIETTLAGNYEVFVSSDPNSIPPGKKWLDQIETSLDETDILIILYSHASKSRPWINFEAGCGWIKKIDIIPICHSGLKISDIGRPISDFQGINVSDKGFSKSLIWALGKKIGLSKLPRISFDEMTKEVRDVCNETYSSNNEVNKEVDVSDQKMALTTDQERILLALAEVEDSGTDIIYEDKLVQFLKMKRSIFKVEAKTLIEMGYIYRGFSVMAPPDYSIKEEGTEYLIKKGILK